MAEQGSADGDFTSVSQTMKDISKSFEAGEKGKGHQSAVQENIIACVGYQDWLQTTQQMQNGCINAAVKSSPSTPDRTENRDNVANKLVTLQEELLAESSKHSVKELMVRSAQLASRLQEILFPRQQDEEEEAVEEEEEGSQKRTWALDLCDRQRSLASDILAHHRVCQSVQVEIDECKRNSRDLQVANVELMKRLQSFESKKNRNGAPSTMPNKHQEELDQTVSQIHMERGILQGLVIGSGVNWAKDDHLREMVLGLGTPLDLDH